MSDVVAVKTHQPCDKCESSDAVAIYNDGHTYCFSCNTYGEAREDYVQPLRKQQPKPDTPWSSRNISKAVQDLYEVTATDLRVVFPYFDNDGMRIAAKIRLQGKEFKTEGDFKNSVLF